MGNYSKLWAQLATTAAIALVSFGVIDAGAQDAVVTVALSALGAAGVYVVPNKPSNPHAGGR